MSDLLKTPLFDEHCELHAKMAEFAGYSMPIQYGGILAEAASVRESCGMFDVSHMARFRYRGNESLDFLQKVTSNDVSKLSDLSGQYSLLCNEAGGCIDDIIVYRITENEFLLVVNAANHQKDWDWMMNLKPDSVECLDETESTFMIAVQGPRAVDLISSLSENPAIKSLPMFGVAQISIFGFTIFAARSGYTGEDGMELIGARTHAKALWKVLMDHQVTPCGLAARDTLRVEAGLPLYGHELSDEQSPLCAGLGWAISKSKPFIGSDAINQVRTNGIPEKLVGVKLASKRLITPPAQIFVDGKLVGQISSGVISPLLDCGIGFAFVMPETQLDSPCQIDLRGKLEPAQIVSKRFLQKARKSKS